MSRTEILLVCHRSAPFECPTGPGRSSADNYERQPRTGAELVAIYTGLRVSELAGLRWNDVHENGITIDERFCRGNWGAPKSHASNTTIAVNRCVIERIHH